MNRVMKAPEMQPLIHHLEDRYGGAYSSEAPPHSSNVPRSQSVDGGGDVKRGDPELRREMEK